MGHQLRKARMADVAAIHRLVNSFADRGEMLPRSLSEIYENLRDYLVVGNEGQIVACGACHVTWEDLAEVKALAVEQGHQRQGLGTRLLSACLEEAKELGVSTIFALTYCPEFFEKRGFRRVEKSSLPQKVWAECIRCSKFPDCGEIALICRLED
jgi:amino-acid N-acetyltransferase